MNQRKDFQTTERSGRGSWRTICAGMAMLVAGLILGSTVTRPMTAWGEIRDSMPIQPHFESGDQVSVPVLREIAAILRQMDGRLARMEVVAQEFQAKSASGKKP